MKPAIALIIILSITGIVFAQHAEITHDGHEESSPYHKLTLVTANTLTTNHIGDQANTVLIVPTFGLNYDFMFFPHWGVGLHSDILLQQFKVEKHNGHEELIRENPVAVCLMGLYKPTSQLSLLAGYGIEIEKHENLQLVRLGVEYGIHLPKSWELGFMLEYDIKLNAYGAFMFGVGFSKILM